MSTHPEDAPPSLVETLQATFPSHPQRHLRWVGNNPEGGKDLRTIGWRATLHDYARHLDPATRPGPGALGVMPGIETNGVWRTPWVVLDFDQRTPEDLVAFFRLLTRHGLTFTFTRGTTGRGAHLWFLLDQAVTLHQASRSLAFLHRVAQAEDLGHLDLRPDSASPDGSGIMLPYRGAGDDGFGVNPMFDSQTGEALPLPSVPDLLRQPAQAFVYLARLRSVEKFLQVLPIAQRPPRLPRLPSVIGSGPGRASWEAEVARLRELWVEGRRSHLTVGATAYGLHLGTPKEQLRADLLGVAEANGDRELDDRRRTIQAGFDRAERGERLAFRPFYEAAGVAPPGNTVSAEVQRHVTEMLSHLMHLPWKGKAGKTDRSLLKTLLGLAWEHGRQHPEGVEVSAAWSQLWREANLASTDTLRQSLLRLETAGWVRRGAASIGTESGSFVLLWTNRSTLFTGGRAPQEYFGLSHQLRNGRGRLGKTKEHVLDMLLWFGPQSARQLAERLETRAVDLKDHIAGLFEEGLIGDGEPGLLHPAPSVGDRVARREERDGSLRSRETQVALYREKQRRYVASIRERRKGD